MRVALLGLSHPHTDIFLTTFVNMPEITSVVLWDADPLLTAKTKRITFSLRFVLARKWTILRPFGNARMEA